MPIHIGWLIKNRVFKYVGDITLQEVIEASKIGLKLIDETDAPLLHTIQDSRNMTSFPKQISSLLESVGNSLSHPRMGWMLSVGIKSDLIRFVARIVSKLTGTRSRMIEDLDEAKAFLNDIDSTLPDLTNISPPADDAFLYHIDFSESLDTA